MKIRETILAIANLRYVVHDASQLPAFPVGGRNLAWEQYKLGPTLSDMLQMDGYIPTSQQIACANCAQSDSRG
jgi:hypothetical protein